MAETRRAKRFQNDGSQAVRLPADFRFDGGEVFITRDEVSGDVTLSSPPEPNAIKNFIAFRDSLDIPQEVLDEFMAKRPVNQPVTRRGIFDDES